MGDPQKDVLTYNNGDYSQYARGLKDWLLVRSFEGLIRGDLLERMKERLREK